MNLPLLFKKLYVLLKLRNEMNRTSQQCIPTIPGFGMFELQDLGEINISYLPLLVQDDEHSGQSYPGYTVVVISKLIISRTNLSSTLLQVYLTGNYHTREITTCLSRHCSIMASIRPIDDDIEQQKSYSNDDDEREISTVAMNSHITSSKWLRRLHCDFPLFSDESVLAYDNYSTKCVNPVIFFPATFVIMSLLACRCGLFNDIYFDEDHSSLEGLRLAATLFGFFIFLFFGLYCTIHFLRLLGRDQMSIALTTRLKKWLPFRLEELNIFSAICTWSLFLIARVIKGQCAAGTTVWQQQTCNPFESSGGIPTELVYSLFVMPTIAQLVFKNISIRVLSVVYLVILAVVAFCVFYSKSNDYFVLINLLFFINITFEITRLQRVNYVEMLKVKRKQKVVLAQLQQKQVIQEIVRTQELLLHRAKDEKRLKEAEAVQLRSLMGNVAHDLKTPLVRKDLLPVIVTSYLF